MAAKGILTKSDYLPIEEYYRLLKCLREDKQYVWELYCSLAGCTALRASDLCRLKWINVLQGTSVVVREKKTGNIRKIQLSPQNLDKITGLYILCGKPDIFSHIIVNSGTEKPYTIQYINSKLKEFKILYRLKIENFSTHSFRKTFGRNLYNSMQNKSEALVLLMDVFKHSSLSTTKRYIGLRDEEVQKAYNLISL